MAEHLTRNRGAYVFQIRVPRSFDPDSCLAPIRVNLGGVRRREAKRLSKLLAGAAHLAFGHVEISAEGANTMENRNLAVARAVKDHLTALLPVVLKGLDAVGRIVDGSTPVSSPAIGARMAQTGSMGC